VGVGEHDAVGVGGGDRGVDHVADAGLDGRRDGGPVLAKLGGVVEGVGRHEQQPVGTGEGLYERDGTVEVALAHLHAHVLRLRTVPHAGDDLVGGDELEQSADDGGAELSGGAGDDDGHGISSEKTRSGARRPADADPAARHPAPS